MMRTRSLAAVMAVACIGLLLAPLSCKNKGEKEMGDAGFQALDLDDPPEDFAAAIAEVRAAQPWDERKNAIKETVDDPRTAMKLKMDFETLDESFKLGSAFLANWQLPEGNFRYMYDWLDGTWVEGDNQVRQAGSLWGVALCHRYRPTPETRAVLDKGLRFWFDHTVDGPDGSLTLKYLDEKKIDSGTVALVALSIVEFLKTDDEISDEYRAELTTKLDGYLAFLVWMQLDNGHISRSFRHDKQTKRKKSSPYYDGESLLCLCKAARELGHDELVPVIEKAAKGMSRTYTIEAWAEDRDSNQTKGFYQWSSMAFAEYYQAKWTDYELYGDVTLALGWWMTHTHETLRKGRNHAYAVEGLASAYRIARWRGDVPAQTDLLYVVDRSLYKLSTWQIGGPLADKNKFLTSNPTTDALAIGGVMNARKKSGRPVSEDTAHQLRIDVTQHQMHAVTLAMEFIYAEDAK